MTITNNFISSKDTYKEQTRYLTSDNIEVITYDNPDETIEELFHLLLSRYQIGLQTQMRESDFIIDCVNLLYDKCHKILNADVHILILQITIKQQ